MAGLRFDSYGGREDLNLVEFRGQQSLVSIRIGFDRKGLRSIVLKHSVTLLLANSVDSSSCDLDERNR